MRQISEDERSLLVDMVRSKGWELFSTINQEDIINYRFLATQAPGSVPEEMRTWYSALAAGREETIQVVKELLNQHEREPQVGQSEFSG